MEPNVQPDTSSGQGRRFEPAGNPDVSLEQTTPSEPVTAEVSAQPLPEVSEKQVNLLDGHFNTSVDQMRDFMPQRAEKNNEGEEQQTQEEPVQEENKNPEQDTLILGKYRTVDDLAKAYKNLERKLGDPKRTIKYAQKAEQLETEKLRLEEELEYYRNNPGIKDEFDERTFNNSIAKNPAKAIADEIERRERQRTRQEDESRKVKRIEEMREKIQDNIEYMREEYPEFKDNQESFAEWMTYYGMNTGEIMSTQEKCQYAYRDFLDANASLEDVVEAQREAGRIEAFDKTSQMPVTQSTRNPSSPQNQGGSRFAPVGDNPNPQMQNNAPAQRATPDAISAMEKNMGIGAYADDSGGLFK